MITWLAWRTHRLPSEWLDEPVSAILTTLRFINDHDRAAQREAERND